MTTDDAKQTLDPTIEKLIKSLFDRLPDSYSDRYAKVRSIRRQFHAELADALTATLNEHVVGLPQDTPEERQEMAAWINQQLRDIGLAVKCPATGQPAVLVVDRQDRQHPEITRFRFSVRAPDGKQSHTAARRNLGELVLTEHRPRIESLSRFFRKERPGGPQR
jgi:hypothetical protein